MVDEHNYFINFLIFLTSPPLRGAVKAVFLPHLIGQLLRYKYP